MLLVSLEHFVVSHVRVMLFILFSLAEVIIGRDT